MKRVVTYDFAGQEIDLTPIPRRYKFLLGHNLPWRWLVRIEKLSPFPDRVVVVDPLEIDVRSGSPTNPPFIR
jgi:hypothetical protein